MATFGPIACKSTQARHWVNATAVWFKFRRLPRAHRRRAFPAVFAASDMKTLSSRAHPQGNSILARRTWRSPPQPPFGHLLPQGRRPHDDVLRLLPSLLGEKVANGRMRGPSRRPRARIELPWFPRLATRASWLGMRLCLGWAEVTHPQLKSAASFPSNRQGNSTSFSPIRKLHAHRFHYRRQSCAAH